MINKFVKFWNTYKNTNICLAKRESCSLQDEDKMEIMFTILV